MPEIASQHVPSGRPTAGASSTPSPPSPGTAPEAGQGADPAVREDLRATIAARRDLGPEFEEELVESFLSRLDQRIAGQVDTQATNQGPHETPGRTAKEGVGMALGSLGLGIPLTAIAASEASTTGLLIAWIGIVGVNLAHAWNRRHR